jgi:hypothetical protein
MGKAKSTKLRIDCLMQWIGSLKNKPKMKPKKETQEYVHIKGMHKR